MTPRPTPESTPDFSAALALGHDGRFDAAIESVVRMPGPHVRGVAAAPFVEALTELARMAERAGDLERAERAYAEAVRLAPNFADLRHGRARLQIALQRRTDARKELDAALKINPDYVAARLERALLDAREGLLAEALDTMKAMAEDRRVTEPRAFRRGLESLQEADWDQAEVLFRQALELTDAALEDVVNAYHQRMAAGEVEGAIAVIRQAIGARETYADLHYLLGAAELEAGLYDDALGSLARALELHPDFHHARVALARVLEAYGDVARATEQIALVLQHEPDHAQALALQERWSRRRVRAPRAA
jgi:tetratricopeptide (TPR) repeat protein